MDINEKIELLEKNLARQLEWIRAADTKIAPVIFITTFLLGTSVAFISMAPELSGFTISFAIICIGMLLYTLFNIIMVNFPRIARNDESSIFFEGVRATDYAGFEKKIASMTRETYFHDLANTCYENALIASVKFGYVKKAMLGLFFAIIPWVVLVYIIFTYYPVKELLGK